MITKREWSGQVGAGITHTPSLPCLGCMKETSRPALIADRDGGAAGGGGGGAGGGPAPPSGQEMIRASGRPA